MRMAYQSWFPNWNGWGQMVASEMDAPRSTQTLDSDLALLLPLIGLLMKKYSVQYMDQEV